jgi:hypothetical protein
MTRQNQPLAWIPREDGAADVVEQAGEYLARGSEPTGE